MVLLDTLQGKISYAPTTSLTLIPTHPRKMDIVGPSRKEEPQVMEEGGGWLSQSGSETTKFWDFGTYNFTLDGTGVRPKPYCEKNEPVDRCVVQDPVMDDLLSDCAPCGMEMISDELKQPLKDRIIQGDPYRECQEKLTHLKKSDHIKPIPRTQTYTSYAPEYQGDLCPCLLRN